MFKYLILFPILLAGCASCLTKPEIQAYIWENNSPIPAAYCAQIPDLQNYGFYRSITKGPDSGKLEFVSFCSPSAVNWQAMYSTDLNAVLNGLVPAPSPAP